ncbi:MAG: hypothetical protein ABI907_05540 [Ramlibacter sp.]
MNKLLSLLALGLALSTTGAFAASHAGAPMKAGGSCDAQATDKKLAGAAKTSFLKKCNADAGPASCDTQATDKKLAGAAKTSFLKKCNADAGPSACDTQATEKKLAGAAKTSFLKKCETDAAAKK